ncbi:MAG: lipoprotein insertase outer membrane protein LolB [Pseudomonadota bacterium]
MRRRALVLLVALLAGCATKGVQELPEITDWPMRQDVLGALEQWELVGRIGIRTPEDSSSGSLSWRQRGVDFRAEIDGPLGIGGVQMVGDPRRVTLSGSKIDTVTVPDPERELWRQTGLRVPVAGLRYWLLGVPLPGEPADIVFGEDGLPLSIAQSGWRIDYTEYRRWSLNALPRRIKAESDDTRLTIVVRDWRIPGAAASTQARN